MGVFSRLVGGSLIFVSALWFFVAHQAFAQSAKYAGESGQFYSELDRISPGASASLADTAVNSASGYALALALCPTLFLAGAVFLSAGFVIETISARAHKMPVEDDEVSQQAFDLAKRGGPPPA